MRVVTTLLVLTVTLSGCTSLFGEDAEDAVTTPSLEGAGTVPIVVIFSKGERLTINVSLSDDTGQVQASRVYRLQEGQREISPLPDADLPCDARTRWISILVHHETETGDAKQVGQAIACDGRAWSIEMPKWSNDPEAGRPTLEPAQAYPGWERGEPWIHPPEISFTKSTGAYPEGGGTATVFTVTKVSNGPIAWRNLNITCADGRLETTTTEGNMGAGQKIYCNGSHLTIIETATGTVLYDRPT